MSVFQSIPDEPSVLPLDGVSAFLGQPPKTQQDYYIVKGIFRMIGMVDANPMAGYFFSAKPPENYMPETRAPAVTAGLIIVMLAITIPTAARVGLRLKRGSTMEFGADDWLIIVAALLALVYPSLQIVNVARGAAGVHSWEVTYAQYNSAMLNAMICKTTFYVAVGLIKLSIALFIRRMADRLSTWWRVICDVLITSIIAYILLSIFYTVFACNPPDAQWSFEARGRREPLPNCINMDIQAKLLSGTHVAQGMALLSTPIIILWKVRMAKAKKIRLFVIWALGGLTVLGGLLRQIRPTFTNDFAWDFVEVLVWTCLDLSLGIITASLPVLDGLLEKQWRKAKATLVNTYSGGRSTQGAATDGGTWQLSRQKTQPVVVMQQKERSESSESIVDKERDEDAYEMGVLGKLNVESSTRDGLQ
ncbi:hypothetical protein B0T11DRAFT_229482 [Plectosphaerella cucumerina]|uniref:Rhodopsin domain-containing protein n=1 Tax=Plectosphaerella cucumerina TaxID=40658 RepID=A0A8K0T7T2_9PEZI|nr:hypothetical protein B0T11DRAFT_229482 [Plectosphaerella cucumerina]